MVLFPRAYRNPNGAYPIAYTWFHGHFRRWVAGLDLEPAVPHQARHTLATRLLAAGASLQHIKRYLGHVSELILSWFFDHGCDLGGHVEDGAAVCLRRDRPVLLIS